MTNELGPTPVDLVELGKLAIERRDRGVCCLQDAVVAARRDEFANAKRLAAEAYENLGVAEVLEMECIRIARVLGPATVDAVIRVLQGKGRKS